MKLPSPYKETLQAFLLIGGLSIGLRTWRSGHQRERPSLPPYMVISRKIERFNLRNGVKQYQVIKVSVPLSYWKTHLKSRDEINNLGAKITDLEVPNAKGKPVAVDFYIEGGWAVSYHDGYVDWTWR